MLILIKNKNDFIEIIANLLRMWYFCGNYSVRAKMVWYKRILLPVLMSAIAVCADSQTLNANYVNYINNYKDEAIAQMKQYKIPASITLAQGLLESAAGRSNLAMASNNHFGIKCHTTWTGARVYADDDVAGECFRKYNTVLESYNDHSLFLLNNKRYSSLFNLSTTDYKGWAKGLKAAGYATAPKYAEQLINLIETYNLAQFDRGGYSVLNSGSNRSNAKKNAAQSAQTIGGAAGVLLLRNLLGYVPHNSIKINGRECVRLNPGTTLRMLSKEYKIPKINLRHFNELSRDFELTGGEIIFLEKKKARVSRKELRTHQVVEGESLWQIAQQHGVRLKPLMRRNNISSSNPISVGTMLLLR